MHSCSYALWSFVMIHYSALLKCTPLLMTAIPDLTYFSRFISNATTSWHHKQFILSLKFFITLISPVPLGITGEGNGSPLWYSCLENSMDGGACRLQSMGLQRLGYDWVTEQQHWQTRNHPSLEDHCLFVLERSIRKRGMEIMQGIWLQLRN